MIIRSWPLSISSVKKLAGPMHVIGKDSAFKSRIVDMIETQKSTITLRRLLLEKTQERHRTSIS